MPKVTVIMPAYNAEAYIGDALRSVAAQTMQDLEVVVVDDGSTDGTVEAARAFADSFELAVLEQKNRGPSAARNLAIRSARGRYCAFLDADDIMLPELLAEQSAVLDADADVGLVFTDIVTFDDGGTIKEAYWRLADTRNPFARLVEDNFVTTSAVMAPTERLIAAGLFPEDRRVAEDYELWLELAVRWKMSVIPRSLVRYRYASGSLSSNRLYSARCALEVIEEFWRRHPDLRRSEPSLYRRSIARHTRNMGVAALAENRRCAAFRYLVKAVCGDPGRVTTWKALAKVLLPVHHGAVRKSS